MSDAKDPYPVEPAAQAGAGQPPAGGSPDKPRPKIDAGGLLDDFDEDADFDADPARDVAVGRKPTVVTATSTPPPEAPEFVKPGVGEARHWAVVGGVLLLCAMIATGVTAPAGIGAGQVALRIIQTVYITLVSTGTGVVALFVAARLLEQRLGNFELAAARMLTAVSAFVLIQSLNLRLTGYWFIDNLAELILAAAAYLFIIAATFKLWSRVPLAYVAGSHMLLWLVMLVGMALSTAIKPAPPRAPGTATPIRSQAPPAETPPPRATPIK